MDLLSILLIIFILITGTSAALIHFKDKPFGPLNKKMAASEHSSNLIYESEIKDYNHYMMKPIERLFYIAVAALAISAVGYVFYRSIVLALLLTPAALYYPKLRKRKIISRRKAELRLQFRDAMQSLSSSLHAGRAFESALKGSISDLLIQYEADSYIVKELEVMARKLETNETVENAFREFAERTHIEEIQGFAEALDICKRTGGNLITAIKSSTDIISDKIEVQNEIQGILAQKKLEQKILCVMPIVIILMLSTSAMDFMLPVYTQTLGRIVMTISMALFILSYFIAEKITNIEV